MLVIGASASGVQLADEIAASGTARDRVGGGARADAAQPTAARDIFWWMDAAGVLDERWDEVDDIIRARHTPSPQLVGSPEHRTVDLRVAAVGRGVA